MNPLYPAISSNCLFHFTNSIDNLLSILEYEFNPRFCIESLAALLAVGSDWDSAEWAIPMVCFCDLPLSQIGFHLSVYGDYGIGMSKSWGQKWEITPVVYPYQGSPMSAVLGELLAFGTNWSLNDDIDNALRTKLSRLVSYAKPYEGNLWRPSGELTDLRFYNEREWRFVPNLPAELRALTAPDCHDQLKREEANKKVSKISKIGFEPSDVKYLIVRREEEIAPFIKELENKKGHKYSYDAIRLLASRVISSEQIRSDF